MIIAIAAYWVATAMLGVALYGATDRADMLFYGIRPEDPWCLQSLYAHILGAIGLWSGYRAASWNYVSRSIGEILSSLASFCDRRIVSFVLLGLCIASTTAHVAAFGAGGLLRRDFYLPELGTLAPIIAQITAIIGIFLGSFLFNSENRVRRVLGLLAAILLVTLIFAKGSRFAIAGLAMAAAIPVLVRFRASRTGSVVAMLAIAAVIIPALHVVISFRTSTTYGLLEYLAQVPAAIQAIPENGYQAIWNVLLNLTFSVPVGEVTISNGTSLHDLIVALNPLPGGVAGWYEIADGRRVSNDIPFSGIGELYGYNPIACFLFAGLAGAAMAWTETLADSLKFPSLKATAWLLFTVFTLLFGLMLLQYNLRSASRLIYYMVIVAVTFKAFDNIMYNSYLASSGVGDRT